MALREELVAAALVLVEEEEEFGAMMMAAAQVAAIEMIRLEEGEDAAAAAAFWVHITVHIDEYHNLGHSFKLHFRMSRNVFEALTQTVRNHLIAKGRLRRERTPIQDIMLMVVWLLATPDTFRSVALRFGVNPGTLYYFYFYIIEVLRELAPQFISWPNAAERETIKNTFQRATGFPGIIGSIDCTHVTITAPLQNPAQYINRHHNYSINVQAVVDSTLLVRDLHVGEVGSTNDSRVFRRTPLQRSLVRPGAFIDPDEHLVGDGAYTQTQFMMVPFPNNGRLNANQLNFNKRLSQARVRVENSFALAKGKWRRLKFLHARNQAVVVDHITASFVVHNFLILNGEPAIDDEELRRPIHVNEVLGQGDEELVGEIEEQDEDGELLEHAAANGIEKRLFYMDYVLPPA